MNSEKSRTSAIRADIAKLNLRIVRASEMDDFLTRADEVSLLCWPEFMLHDPVANRFWQQLNTARADFQFALIENTSEKWIAVGNSIPVSWVKPFKELPDKGWDWALRSGMEEKYPPNVLCALAIQVHPDARGRGLSALMVRIMKDIGLQAGLERLIAPVRPNKKSDYPLLPMQEYIKWSRKGAAFDPWVRVHEHLGAKVIKVCSRSMHIYGNIQEWQAWTGLSFQSSGQYLIRGALNSINIDVENDRGDYVEPNVWMLH